jgi:hypothetical protein
MDVFWRIINRKLFLMFDVRGKLQLGFELVILCYRIRFGEEGIIRRRWKIPRL